MTRTRRSVLRAGCGVLAGGVLAGCVGESSPGGSGSDTGSGTTLKGPASSTNTAVRTDTPPTTAGHRTERPTTAGNEDGPSTAPERTETRRTATDTTRPGTTTSDRACNGARYLSFYALSDLSLWTRRTIYVAYSLGTNANVLLVAFEGDTVLGTADSSAPGGGVAVDGQPIRLDEPLAGEHTLRVVMYADPEGAGTFDAGSATPCRHDGAVIQAGPETIDFSGFAPGASTTS